MPGLRSISLLLAMALASCSTQKIDLPKADSIRIEPLGKSVEPPMQTEKLASFIEGLGGDWKQPWHTPPSGGITLLFRNGNEITSTVYVVGDWIGIRSGTSTGILESTLSRSDRMSLDRLLAETK